MPMTMAILKVIAEAITGWSHLGFCPIDASVENWGCAGCARWVVVLNSACIEGRENVFLMELDNSREAGAYAQKVNDIVDYICRQDPGDEVPLDVFAGK